MIFNSSNNTIPRAESCLLDEQTICATRSAIKAGMPVAIYSIPGECTLRWICGSKPRRSSLRLVAVDFDCPYSSGCIIYDEFSPQDILDGIDIKRTTVSQVFGETTDKRQYLADVNRLKSLLSSEGGKVVLSRVICGQSNALAEDCISVALSYFSVTPSNFNILIHTPETGTWIISTPERLLKIDRRTRAIETMALAGTLPAKNAGHVWDDKNIREQAIVANEIIRQLYDNGVTDITTTDSDVISGAVMHRCTSITGYVHDANDYSKLLDILSPTPALGGSPRHRAIRLIGQYEKHPRHLYGGYISIENERTAQSFVTLRCANINEAGQFCIYTGSGILSDSDAETEFDETSLKASILLNSILSQHQNNG